MAFTHPALEILFLCVVAGLWSMILYQLLFAFLGIRFHRASERALDACPSLEDAALPAVSILVPAHNEEIVLRDTIASLLALDYPKSKLEILIVNDGSTDGTAQLVERSAAENPCVRLWNVPPESAASGKGNALNVGIEQARFGLVAVYDADNTPEPHSLRILVQGLLSDPKAAATFGKFRTRNRAANLLTRFINLETLSFQFMIQAGRYLLFKLALLPGTNFVARREVLLECGGWDPNALTEDTELSVRLYQRGYQIRYVPDAVTWEEEPQKWGVWVRQRTRWVRGNFYVVRKHLLSAVRSGRIGLAAELLHLLLLYYFFLFSILLSHLFFVSCASGWIAVLSPGPYFAVWVCAFLLFMAELCVVSVYERETLGGSMAVAFVMYFTYCQGWLVVVLRALYQEWFEKGRTRWEKTRRFGAAPLIRRD